MMLVVFNYILVSGFAFGAIRGPQQSGGTKIGSCADSRTALLRCRLWGVRAGITEDENKNKNGWLVR